MYKFLDIHTHKDPQNSDIISIMSATSSEEIPSNGSYSIGVHPWHVSVAQEKFEAIDFNNPRIIAIGEVGLDFRFPRTVAQQIVWFEKQLKLAQELNLPVIVHSVKALPQILNLLKKWKIQRFIIHGFRGSLSAAQDIIEMGGKVSFGEALLKDHRLGEVAKEIGIENLFLESDNSDTDIRELYRRLSEITSTEIEELQERIYNNFTEYFKHEQ